MSKRTRMVLAAVALALLVVSALALAYALDDSGALSEQIRLAPTLFVPPGGLR